MASKPCATAAELQAMHSRMSFTTMLTANSSSAQIEAGAGAGVRVGVVAGAVVTSGAVLISHSTTKGTLTTWPVKR